MDDEVIPQDNPNTTTTTFRSPGSQANDAFFTEPPADRRSFDSANLKLSFSHRVDGAHTMTRLSDGNSEQNTVQTSSAQPPLLNVADPASNFSSPTALTGFTYALQATGGDGAFRADRSYVTAMITNLDADMARDMAILKSPDVPREAKTEAKNELAAEKGQKQQLQAPSFFV